MELFDITPWVGSPEIRDRLKEAWSPTVWDMERLIVHAHRPLEERIKGLWELQRFAESREERAELKRTHGYLRFCLRQIREDAPGSLYRWSLWGRCDEPDGRLHLGGGLAASYGAMLDELEGLPRSAWGLGATRYLMGERGPEALISFEMEYFDGRFAETGFILAGRELARADFEGEDFEQFRLAEQRYYDLPHAGPYPYPLPFSTGDLVRLDFPSRRTPILGILLNAREHLYMGCLREGRLAALDINELEFLEGRRAIDCLFRADPAQLPPEGQILPDLGGRLRALPSEQAAEAFFCAFGGGGRQAGRRRHTPDPLS